MQLDVTNVSKYEHSTAIISTEGNKGHTRYTGVHMWPVEPVILLNTIQKKFQVTKMINRM